MTVTLPRRKTPLETFADPEIRVEGRDKVSGKAQYTGDVTKPNMLWAAFAVSSVPHARIVSIDTSAAKEVPGVRAILTGADIGDKRFGRHMHDWPVLAFEKVRFIGERVAAVAAETKDAAEEAARLIDVEYDELPAVFVGSEALKPDAPILHEDSAKYIFASGKRPPVDHPNLQGRVTHRKGAPDLEPLFKAAHRVFDHRFTTPRQHHGYIEPRACLVQVDPDGVVRVYSPCKSPFRLRQQMSVVTGVPAEKIIVEPTYIGGDFGGKGLVVDEFACYYLARATGRPVKAVMSYVDELQGTNCRHPSEIRVRTGVDKDGKFLVHHGEIIYNGGAYAATKPGKDLIPGQVGWGTVGYHVPNVLLEVRSAYTNTTPSGHMRAPADVQTFFAWEIHVDVIARELGVDPLELRLRNVIKDGDTALTGEHMLEPKGREVLETLRRETDWSTPMPPGRGRGISFVCRHTGGGKTSLRLRLHPNDEVDVLYGTPDQGSGSATVIRRIISAELGIEPEKISIRRGSTDEAPNDPGAGASRVTHIMGRATLDAVEKLRPHVGKKRSDTIEVSGAYNGEHHDAEHPADYSFSAFAVDVEVDRATGEVTLLGATLSVEVGPIINPVAHRGQIEGGFVYGVGGAFFEELIDEDGKLSALNLGEYKLPTQMDVPPLRTIHVAAGIANGPYGAKMAGELSNSGVAPAVANAVYNAVGAQLTTFPITAERVYEALTS
ncbi:MAG TPA: xanthine dehydrogenase family protein molybdopterin-binding subunit [Candidatus Binatia bacterium]|nr:xanthine dehydrogenase family protein molybdopterin-binding subunit [Candidatus Binatia bacterium]